MYGTSSILHTRGKSLLVERKSVSCPLQLHVHSWQGAPLIHKLHCQSGGVRRAVWQFKLGPQRPSTCGASTNKYSLMNDWSSSIPQYPQWLQLEIGQTVSCGKHRCFTFIFRLFWDITQLPQALVLLRIPKIIEITNINNCCCSIESTLFVLLQIKQVSHLTRWSWAETACWWLLRQQALRSVHWWAAQDRP